MHEIDIENESGEKCRPIQRKPSESDVRSFAATISPTNGRNITKVNTTCQKSEYNFHFVTEIILESITL